jgi:hypothetical protein
MKIFRSDEYETPRESSLAGEIESAYIDKLATMQDDVYEGISAEQYIRSRNMLNSKTAFQEMVDSLASRAGLKQYIELINSEVRGIESKGQEKRPESLLDIESVKSEVDKALENKKFDSYINLLNELSKQVKNNDLVPDYLKNVMGDKKLKDYVIEKMPSKSKRDNELHLDSKKDGSESIDDSGKPYFNFNSTDDQHK